MLSRWVFGLLAIHGAVDLVRSATAQTELRPLYMPRAVDGETADLEGRVAVLEALLANVSRNDRDMVISGTNLRIVNGAGLTDGEPNGLGNLIIGYNEMRGGLNEDGTPIDQRTGSHTLVIGKGNNYSGYGGLVVGSYNSLSGAWANVLGGRLNIASGENSTCVGGIENRAEGTAAMTAGGTKNVAKGWWNSITGGSENTTQGDYASIGGGWRNAIGRDAEWSVISGGQMNQVSGTYSSISGGGNITVDDDSAWAAGNLHSP